jgi:AraC family transcriptional regulator
MRARSLGARPSTRDARQAAVVSAIELMRDRIGDPLALRDLARAALLSPYHFNRVFHAVTGTPPGRFLTALRMAAARRLLLTSDVRVTDVCFTVGFESLGTFTTRFGQLVGLSPLQLRALSWAHGERPLAGLVDWGGPQPNSVSGWLDPVDHGPCTAIVGAFRTALPQGLPVACGVSSAPGPFCIGPLPDGAYHLLALGFPGAQTVMDAMLLEQLDILVATARLPILKYTGRRVELGRLRLKQPSMVDPPVVLAAPVLSAARGALVQVA